MPAEGQGPGPLAVTLGAAGAACCLLALVYAPALVGRLDPDPPLLETTLHGIRRSRVVLTGLGVVLVGLSIAVAREGPWSRWLARPLTVRVAVALVCLALPLAVAEIVLRPFIVPRTTIFLPDPRLGWRLRPGATDRWLGIPVEINRKGLRGPEVDYTREPGAVRIVYLGDSVTFGAFVASHEDTFPYRVERVLERGNGLAIETVNAAVGGYSPWQEGLWLESEGWRYAPDLVVVAFVLNDVLEEAVLSDEAWLPHRWQLRHTARTPWDRLANRSGLIHAATVIGRRIRWSDEQDVPAPRTSLSLRSLVHEPERSDVVQAWRTTLDSLERLFGACRERGVPAVLVVVPLRSQVLSPREPHGPQETLREFAAPRQIPLIDLLPPLAGDADAARLYHDEVHLSAAGHALAAEHLAALLLGEGLARPATAP